LKIVPPSKPTLRSFKIVSPLELQLTSEPSSSSESSVPSSSFGSLSESPSDPSSESPSESSSLFGSLFSSKSPSESTSSSELPLPLRTLTPLPFQPLSKTPALDPHMRKHLEKHFATTPRKDLLELFINVRQDRLALARQLRQIKSIPPPPLSPPTSPLSPYKPPHLRQDQKSTPSVPAVGPPFVTQMSIVRGCFYCHNKYVDKNGLFVRHKHRNKCPWFQHHLAVGTCHLNDVGELCLGPKLVGRQGVPLPFWNSKISQGEQVKRRTDGTEYDEVLANRLRNPVVFRHY
jgi:hypothetical protein